MAEASRRCASLKPASSASFLRALAAAMGVACSTRRAGGPAGAGAGAASAAASPARVQGVWAAVSGWGKRAAGAVLARH
jgi:hypothetical protein